MTAGSSLAAAPREPEAGVPQSNGPQLWVILPAGGSGSRMASDQPKQYLSLAGKTVLERSLAPFLQRTDIAGIAVALASNDKYGRELLAGLPSNFIFANGGAERADSVANALQALAEAGAAEHDWVLVHDAARPCLPIADLALLINSVKNSAVGGILAVPVRDTLKLSGNGQKIDRTVDRTSLWQALTPQMFRFGLLRKALQHCADTQQPVTDEASAVEQLGEQPLLVTGSLINLKITWPADIALAEKLLELLE